MVDVVRGLDVALGIEGVINQAQVTVYPVETVGTVQVIWTARAVLRVAPGQSRVLSAPFRDDNGARVGAVDVVAPAATTDYLVNDKADGTGYNYTTDPAFSISTTIEATRALITLGNTATGPLFVTFFQVRGKPIRVYDPINLAKDDAASQAAYGVHGVSLDLAMQDDPTIGMAYAEYLVGRFAAPSLAAERLVVKQDDTLAGVNVFSLNLMNKVVISDAESGLSAAGHWIRAIEYEVTGGKWTATFDLERADDRKFMILDKTGYCELDSAGAYLGF